MPIYTPLSREERDALAELAAFVRQSLERLGLLQSLSLPPTMEATNASDQHIMALPSWPKLEENWISAVYSPRIEAWVKLADGRELRAIYVMGEWETLDGQVITGVKHWQPILIEAVKAV